MEDERLACGTEILLGHISYLKWNHSRRKSPVQESNSWDITMSTFMLGKWKEKKKELNAVLQHRAENQGATDRGDAL